MEWDNKESQAARTAKDNKKSLLETCNLVLMDLDVELKTMATLETVRMKIKQRSDFAFKAKGIVEKEGLYMLVVLLIMKWRSGASNHFIPNNLPHVVRMKANLLACSEGHNMDQENGFNGQWAGLSANMFPSQLPVLHQAEQYFPPVGTAHAFQESRQAFSFPAMNISPRPNPSTGGISPEVCTSMSTHAPKRMLSKGWEEKVMKLVNNIPMKKTRPGI